MLRHALIHAFIPPANENDPLQSRVPPRRFLRESFPCRGQQNDRRTGRPRCRLCCISHPAPKQRLHRLKHWFRLHHHPLAAAKRTIVHRAMPVFGELAQILHPHINQPGFASPPHNPMFQRTSKKLRENRNQVKSHARFSLAYFQNAETSPALAGGTPHILRRTCAAASALQRPSRTTPRTRRIRTLSPRAPPSGRPAPPPASRMPRSNTWDSAQRDTVLPQPALLEDRKGPEFLCLVTRSPRTHTSNKAQRRRRQESRRPPPGCSARAEPRDLPPNRAPGRSKSREQ